MFPSRVVKQIYTGGSFSATKKFYLYTVHTVQKWVDSPLRVSILDSIRDSLFLGELRIENKLSRIE